MDRQTLSNYGWIVIAVLILAVMLAFATPFGKYIGRGVSNLAMTMVGANDNAVDKNNIEQMGKEWDEYLNPVIAGATFTDGTFLTWEELKLAENSTKYRYNTSAITDTTIGDFAFSCCSYLKSIIIPKGVTNIGDGAFEECSVLTSITLPDSITTIGNGAFSCCISLTSIDLPESLTSLDDGAFNYCISLTSITIPDSVTTIGIYAFSQCESLTSIALPDSITTISEYIFQNCDSLTSITFNGTKAQWSAITKGTNWKESTGNFTVYCTDGNISKSNA